VAAQAGSPVDADVNEWLHLRVGWQARVYDADLPAQERREWAAACVECVALMCRDAGYEPWSAAVDRAVMRAYVIRYVGEVVGSELWDAAALAREVSAELELSPAEAARLAADWRSLPRPRIAQLRRHKTLVGALRPIADWLPTGQDPVVDEWLAVWAKLP
jgi:hypothetical protein